MPIAAQAKGNKKLFDIRVFYTKTGMAKYTSHLDMNRLFSRAIKRAKLDVWYSQGFNPHIYISFSQPLPLGYESLCESFDVKLLNKNDINIVKNELNKCLPSGIQVTKANFPGNKTSDITKACYSIKIYSNSLEKLYDSLKNYLCQDSLIVDKKTKKGITSIDLAPLIYKKDLILTENYVKLEIVLPAGIKQNINPTLIIDNFTGDFDNVNVLKTSLLCTNGNEFK